MSVDAGRRLDSDSLFTPPRRRMWNSARRRSNTLKLVLPVGSACTPNIAQFIRRKARESRDSMGWHDPYRRRLISNSQEQNEINQ